MIKYALLVTVLAACDKGASPTKEPGMAPRAQGSVSLTSVAFADDCGGTPPMEAPAPASPAPKPAAIAPAEPASRRRPGPGVVADESVDRRCEQTAMQLAITDATEDELHIQSVEVFDEGGKSIGKLVASKPTRWSAEKTAYEPWDEKASAGTTAVSYVLSQPTFVDLYDARDHTYTVKVVAALGGVEQPLQKTVLVVGRPAPVPT